MQKQAEKDPAKVVSLQVVTLLTLLVLVNTVMMGAVAWFQYQSHLKEASKPTLQDIVKAEMQKAEEGSEDEAGEPREEDGILFPLETFTANLAQGDGHLEGFYVSMLYLNFLKLLAKKSSRQGSRKFAMRLLEL